MYITTYDAHASLIETTIKKWWGILQKEPKHGHLFRDLPMFVYRKGKTIGNVLVRAEIEPDNKKIPRQKFLRTQKNGTFSCLSCQNCACIIKGSNIMHPTKGNPIPIKGFHTCNSSNVIYSLKCPCGKIYIGQTTRPVKIRLNEHRSAIRKFNQEKDKVQREGTKWRETGVARHFSEASHNVSDLRWQIIEEIHGKNNSETKKETFTERSPLDICSANVEP